MKLSSSSSSSPKKVYKAYTASSDGDYWGLVEDYLPLVKSTVSKMRIYFPDSVDSEDIYSIALTGLISAVKQYDPTKERAFGSYAKIKVKGALLDELRKIDTLSRDDRQKAKKFTEKLNRLEAILQRPPNEEEICKELNITAFEYNKIKDLKNPSLIPLNSPIGLSHNSQNNLLDELISDPTEQNSREITQNKELIELLRACLETLDVIPQKVLVMYYLENMRLAEIAVVLDLTESRICQIHSKALSELRTTLTQKMFN